MAVTRPSGIYDSSYAQDMAIVRTHLQWTMLVGLLILLFALPHFLPSRLLTTVNYIGIMVIAVHGLNILTGYCGQISLGQAAFMLVGAYTSAVLVKSGFPFFPALVCAVLLSGIIGVVFGLPSLRVKGFYLAMATLAAQFIIPAIVAYPLAPITGGTARSFIVPPPEIGGIVFNTQFRMFYIIVPLAVIMTFFAKNIVRTGTGRAFIAVRDNDLAAEVSGINIFRTKLIAFFICSAYAGLAGCLWAHWSRALNPTYAGFTLMDSIWLLGMMIVGGMGSIAGTIFGVIFLKVVDEFSKWLGALSVVIIPAWAPFLQAGFGPILYGLVIVLFLVLEPRGLAHLWEIFKNRYRLRPFTY